MHTPLPSPPTGSAPSALHRSGLRKRRFSLRSQLALLCAGLILPILVFVGFILWQFASAERTRLEGNALDTAHMVAAALDRELTGLRSALRVLALSPHLQSGDLESFHRQVSETQRAEGVNAVLRTPDGQQLVNASRPFGEIPIKVNLPTDPAVVASRQPVVSDLFVGRVSGEPGFAITMPVLRNGEIVYLLSLGQSVERIRQITREAGLPTGWTVAVVDRQGVILARNSRHEEFVGKPATKDLQENTAGSEGTWNGSTVDGQRVFGAYSRSLLSDWRVAVGVRDEDLSGPLRQSLWYLALLGTGLVALSAFLALIFGRHITAPMQMLAERAAALGRGEPVAPMATRIREVARVGDALAVASADLRKQERERDAAEEALRTTERRLTEILESMNDFYYALDQDFRFIEVNRRIEEITGKTREDLIGRRLWDVFPKAQKAEGYGEPPPTGERRVMRGETFSDALQCWVEATLYRTRDRMEVYFRDISDRKRAEEALRESEARFRALTDAVPAFVWFATPDGALHYLNRRWYEYTGQTPEQALPNGWATTLHPEDAERTAGIWADARTRGVTYEVELRYRRHDGEYRWYIARAEPLRDDGGAITAWFGTSTDIHDRKRAEAALRESEERFRFALEAAGGVGTWDWDVVADRLHANDTFAALFGVDARRAAEGPPVSEYMTGIHPDDRERANIDIQRAIKDGTDLSTEYRVIGLDGVVRWVVARGRCYHDGKGKPIRFPGIVIDITERKRTEEALSESQSRLQAILDTVPVGIIIAEAPSGRIIGGNAQVEHIFGHPVLPSPDIESYRDWISFHPDGRQVQVEEFPLTRALGGEERPELEVLYQRGNDQRIWIRLIGAPIRDETGHIIAGVVACLDVDREKRAETVLREFNVTLEQRIAEAIVDREKAEAQLRQAQKMEAVGRLTGGVAHDFNNLLTVVTGNLDMLRRRIDALGDPRLLRNVDNAFEGARRAAQLTHRLLAFSRQSPLQPEILDLNKIVSGTSELLRRTIGENIAIETVLAGGLWRTEADPNQLESAILNLAVNARDAMPDGGKLTVETANTYLDEAYAASTSGEVKAGQYVMVSVSDTGTGMTPDVKAKVFEPFFTTKPVGKGTGLGLAQVYGFARQSGGHAAVYSEPGQGTTVKLYFPRVMRAEDRAPAPQVEEVPTLPLPSARGETILVVEDEEMVRDFSISVLEDAGYRVLSAEDGPSALELLHRHRDQIALLFTDVVLTGPMNGRKIADEALKLRPDLKVLFTTGYTRNAIIHHGRLDEGVHLITKPFAAASLTERVRRLLDEV